MIVPDFQLSLAIGKEGQNARLAARLTGWRVDIKSETQLAEEESGGGYAEGEWVEGPDGELVWQPAEGGEAISAAEAGYATLGGDAAAAADAPPPTPPAAAAAADAEAAAEEAGSEPRAAEPAAAGRGATDGDAERPDVGGRAATPAAPQRTCVGCRRQGLPERLAADRSRPATVRYGWDELRPAGVPGAAPPTCFEEAVRRGALARALRRPLTTTELDELRARLCN